MTPELYRDLILVPTLTSGILPARMDSPMARVMMVAIGLQESNLSARRQGAGGPARGFHQFERGSPSNRGGVWGVFNHRATRDIARDACERLHIRPVYDSAHIALEFCDPLDLALSRLLLWTLPQALPAFHSVYSVEEQGWAQYIAVWRPGKPRPSDWPANWKKAMEVCA